MIHSFLLIGQSNMAGRGFPNEVEPIINGKIRVLRNGRWQHFYVPVNPDGPASGINLSESFADLYSKEKDVEVGLIPCAHGGTTLDQWQVGGLLFDNACNAAMLAQRTSTIAGVLWHQGESDCADHLYPHYEEKLTVILDEFRKRLNLYDVPFLLGGLGDFLEDHGLKNYPHVNDALERICKKREMTGFVSAHGLTANADNLHFSAKGLREFGVRYYEEFKKLEDKNKVFVEKSTPDAAIRTEFENL